MIIQGKNQLAELLPHSGNMVLLDSVESCGVESIRCGAESHLDPSNPLAVDGAVSVYAGIEYAAQAMALHNRLAKGRASAGDVRQGVVAVASKLKAHVDRLEGQEGRLTISVSVLERTEESSIYSFDVSCAGSCMIEGRLLVVLL